jgi:hypothetical protein
VVYVAHGSHAAYFRPGVRDRTFPDPNDEADGRGVVAAPAGVTTSAEREVAAPAGVTASAERGMAAPAGVTASAGARVVRYSEVAISERAPAWMRHAGRWGAARAGWVPGEEDSPRGPAFQPQGRWSDPDGWARAARPCTRAACDERGECDGRETAIALGFAAVPLLGVVAVVRRRRR